MSIFNLHKTLLFNFLPDLFLAHGWFLNGPTCTADYLQYTCITIQVHSSAEHHQPSLSGGFVDTLRKKARLALVVVKGSTDS